MIPGLLWAVEANATQVLVTLCGSYQVGFIDTHEDFNTLDDDYFRDNGDKAARGAEVHVKNLTTQNDIVLTLPWNGGVSDTDACIGTLLTQGTSYSIKLHSTAVVNGNTLAVHAPGGGPYVHIEESSWAAVAGPKNIRSPLSGAWNIAAAAGVRDVPPERWFVRRNVRLLAR